MSRDTALGAPRIEQISVDWSGRPMSATQRVLVVDFETIAKEYVEPDHRFGESFPGAQAPTQQLTLFSVGFSKGRVATSAPPPAPPSSPEATMVAARATPDTGCEGVR